MKLHLSPVLFRALMSLIAAAAPLAGAAHAASLTTSLTLTGNKVYNDLEFVAVKDRSMVSAMGKVWAGAAVASSGNVTFSAVAGDFLMKNNAVGYHPSVEGGRTVVESFKSKYDNPDLRGGAYRFLHLSPVECPVGAFDDAGGGGASVQRAGDAFGGTRGGASFLFSLRSPGDVDNSGAER